MLLGVSRTSKTPTSIYLANRGYKTINIPLVLEQKLPENLNSTTKACVVGLVALAPYIALGRNKKRITVGIFFTTILVGPIPVALRLMDYYYGTDILPANGSDALWWILGVHGALMASLGALGFGFLEVGTVTPRPQYGNPKPRIFRNYSENSIINRLGFNNNCLLYTSPSPRD